MTWPDKSMLCVEDTASLDACAREVAWVVGHLGSSLLLYHVLPPDVGPDRPGRELAPAPSGPELSHDEFAQLRVEAIQEPADYGNLVDAITTRATESGVDLLLVPTHARSGFGRLVFDSVAERLVRSCRFPVLTFDLAAIPAKGESAAFDAVVVATDLSPRANAVIPRAADLARRLDCPLVLFHAIEMAYAAPIPMQGFVMPAVDTTAIEAGIRRQLETIADGVRATGLAVEIEAPIGTVVSALDEVTERFSNALVVTTTAGRDSLIDLVIGSRAERMIRHAKSAVLTFPVGALDVGEGD